MGVEAHAAEKSPCRNCGKEIYLSCNGEWFHYHNGQNGKGLFMTRCDGQFRKSNDNSAKEWAQPTRDGEASPVDHSSYTHPAVTKPVSPQRQLLLDAADTVDGERQDQYGNAEDSFAVIAELWSSYINIGRPQSEQIEITAKDVALMMVLFKVAREGNSPKRDNLLDLAGYAALAQRIEEKS